MENLRRRTEREVADARLYGIASFARDVLGVADNMQRALQALGHESARKGRCHHQGPARRRRTDRAGIAQGRWRRHGIKKIEPLGEKFDPNFHQAMYEVPDASVPAGSVVQVIQPGYLIGERMLRPALVAVAKGGAKAAAPEPVANDNVSASPRGPGAA